MDYSPYYYNYNPKNQKPPKEPRYGNYGNYGKSYIRKNIGSILLIAIILISFIVTLYLAGRFSGADLYSEIAVSLSKKDTVKYYMVTLAPYEYKEEAIIKCSSIRANGGAGYLYVKENQFFVAMATYTDKKSAEEVVNKNENLVMHELSLDKRKLLKSISDDGITKECIEAVESLITKLENLTYSFAKNEVNLLDALHTLENERNAFLTLKKKVIELAPQNSEKLQDLINPCFGGLEAIISVAAHNNFLAELRYVNTASVISLCLMDE